MTRRRWALFALAALIAVDLVLVFLALRPSRPAQQVTPAALPPTEVPAQVESTPSAAGVPQDDQVETGPPAQANMLVVNSDGSLALAEPGTCGGAQAEIWQLAVDSYEWVLGELPGAVIMRFDLLAGDNLISVSSPTTECGELWFRSSPGSTLQWGPEQGTDGVFYLRQEADGTASVNTLLSLGPSPCTGRTIALAATDQEATVACDSGEVFRNLGPGSNWVPTGTLAEIRAVTYGESGLLYALSTAPDCNGLAVWQSTDGGAQWQQNGCAELADSNSGVALAATGNDLVIVDTNRVPYRSSDAGRTFRVGS